MTVPNLLNLYGFVGNAAVGAVDLHGHGPLTWLMAGVWDTDASTLAVSKAFFGSLASDTKYVAENVAGGFYAIATDSSARDVYAESVRARNKEMAYQLAERWYGKAKTFDPYAKDFDYYQLAHYALRDAIGVDPLAEGIYGVDLSTQALITNPYEQAQRILNGGSGLLLTGTTLYAAGTRGINNVCARSATKSVKTPYGPAVQEQSAAALRVRSQIQQGGTVYKGGVLGRSETGASQFLATESPLNPGYAGRYGIPPQNAQFDFIMGGRVCPGAPVITRSAPGIPPNPGNGIEGVINSGGLMIDWFHMP